MLVVTALCVFLFVQKSYTNTRHLHTHPQWAEVRSCRDKTTSLCTLVEYRQRHHHFISFLNFVSGNSFKCSFFGIFLLGISTFPHFIFFDVENHGIIKRLWFRVSFPIQTQKRIEFGKTSFLCSRAYISKMHIPLVTLECRSAGVMSCYMFTFTISFFRFQQKLSSILISSKRKSFRLFQKQTHKQAVTVILSVIQTQSRAAKQECRTEIMFFQNKFILFVCIRFVENFIQWNGTNININETNK